MSDPVRRALARLAAGDAPAAPAPSAVGGGPSDEEVIDRAAAAADDVEAAAAFVEEVGVDRLRVAVARTDGETAWRGKCALAAFEWVWWAAEAEVGVGHHFRPGRGTHLTRSGEPPDG